MENKRINGNDLIALGFKENHTLGVALKINSKRHGYTREEMLEKFRSVLEDPTSYSEDAVFGILSSAILGQDAVDKSLIVLNETPVDYAIYGASEIETGAKAQMNVAMKLPVAVAGALMPDAHQGYGLPIGGVLATSNAVIPYGEIGRAHV
mgnify:FL=1